MSTHAFDGRTGLILVAAHVVGPVRSAHVLLALDTGATTSVLNAAILHSIGCDVAASRRRVAMTTGSGVEFVASVIVPHVNALGMAKANVPVLSHTLPASAKIDGLIGLDFLRSALLVIDFRDGLLTVN